MNLAEIPFGFVRDALVHAGFGGGLGKLPNCTVCNGQLTVDDNGRFGTTVHCSNGCSSDAIVAPLEPYLLERMREAEVASMIVGEKWPARPLAVDRAVPVFPLDALPEHLGEFVSQLAVQTQTPVDLAGMLVLATLAASAAKLAVVEIRDGWREPLNLYVAVVLPPAARKSSVHAEVTKPLRRHEREEAERTREERARAQSALKLAERRLDVAIDRAAKASPSERHESEAEVARLTNEKRAAVVPPEPRLVVDDCTPEKLATLLSEQGGRMAVLSPEGGVFELMAGRYSDKGANLDVYLKAHAGDDLRVDRVGRPSDHVERPALTFGLAIQPDVLRSLRDQPGFRGRGLLGRFLYALPRNTVGSRKSNPSPLSPLVAARYEQSLSGLLKYPPARTADSRPVEHVLKLSSPALEALLTFMDELEPKLGHGGELEHIGDWAGKLAGAVCRIAGLLHLATEGSAAFTTPISELAMARAQGLGRYLLAHALAAFDDMACDPASSAARAILRHLQHHSEPEPGWTTRAVHQALRKRAAFAKADSLADGFDLLVDHGWLRLRHEDAQRQRPGTGGRSSLFIDLHPSLTGSKGSNGQPSRSFEPFEPIFHQPHEAA